MDRRPCHPMGLLGLVQNTEEQFGSERSQDDRPHTAVAAPIPNQEGSCSGIQVLNSSVATNPIPMTAQQQSCIRPRAQQSLSLTIQSQPAHAQAIPSASACSGYSISQCMLRLFHQPVHAQAIPSASACSGYSISQCMLRLFHQPVHAQAIPSASACSGYSISQCMLRLLHQPVHAQAIPSASACSGYCISQL